MIIDDVFKARCSLMCEVLTDVIRAGCTTYELRHSGQPQELAYGSEVQLIGTITQERFPVPPKYEDQGDTREDYWILHLNWPIDLAAVRNNEMQPGESTVQEVQLVLDGQTATNSGPC